MDQQGQLHYDTSQYEPNQVMGNPSQGSVVTSGGPAHSPSQPSGSHLAHHQLAYQHIHQQQQHQLQQQLQSFWANQYQEIEKVNDFKNHNLPLARIKKIMKADEDVRMISAEAPIVFARACEMFILELTLRSWNHTEENKRRTLQKNDIAAAITRTDIFDFLVDIVPREDLKDEALASIPRGTVPVGGPTDAYPYYYMPAQHSPQGGAPGMIVGQPVMDPVLYAQQPHPYMAQQMWPQISKVWELPVSILLKLTIPQTSPSQWNRFYRSANIVLCPLALLYSCNSFMPLNHPISFLLPNSHFPLWLVVLFACSSLAVLHHIVQKEPPKTEEMPVVLIAFVMSVFWISVMAGELLNCLAALGALIELPPALLGLTVLAWGNSVGDLVADVAVAKAGQPALAMAGCFAGPMFNMLFGLGTALVIQTANVYPKAYELHFHVSIVVAFVFLLLSLMGSLLVITWYRFRVPRFWGFCLVGLYVSFIAVSLVIAKFTV